MTRIFEGATLTSVALWLQASSFKLLLQKQDLPLPWSQDGKSPPPFAMWSVGSALSPQENGVTYRDESKVNVLALPCSIILVRPGNVATAR